MKLWSMTYQDDDSSSGMVREWFGTKKEMKARLFELQNDPPCNFQMYRQAQIPVPTNKADLISFLNRRGDE